MQFKAAPAGLRALVWEQRTQRAQRAQRAQRTRTWLGVSVDDAIERAVATSRSELSQRKGQGAGPVCSSRSFQALSAPQCAARRAVPCQASLAESEELRWNGRHKTRPCVVCYGLCTNNKYCKAGKREAPARSSQPAVRSSQLTLPGSLMRSAGLAGVQACRRAVRACRAGSSGRAQPAVIRASGQRASGPVGPRTV